VIFKKAIPESSFYGNHFSVMYSLTPSGRSNQDLGSKTLAIISNPRIAATMRDIIRYATIIFNSQVF
jgi:hypothetical protein